jgi:hypothetical protein
MHLFLKINLRFNPRNQLPYLYLNHHPEIKKRPTYETISGLFLCAACLSNAFLYPSEPNKNQKN